MNLYLMRHGVAVPADDPGVVHDNERPLTAKGIKRLRRAGRGLRRLDIPFDAILTSPILRARQSAEIVAAALGKEALLEEISGLAPESTLEQLLAELTLYHHRDHLLLVGHQPLVGQTIGFMLYGKRGQQLDIDVRKGSLCRIEVDVLPPSTAGTLHWFLTPKQLRLLGQRSPKS